MVTDGERIVAASSPAGPAFEGGMLRFGMAGADGAIEAVHINDDAFDYQVIGGYEPEGICGSGLVDIIAELRRVEWMTPEGRFADGGDEYTIAPSKGITFSRADASQLAQAKASNASGQRILLRKLGLDAERGRPGLPRRRLRQRHRHRERHRHRLPGPGATRSTCERVGNSALRGAAMLLLSRRRREALSDIIGRIEHVELETEPDFFELFVDGCMFHPIPSTAA